MGIYKVGRKGWNEMIEKFNSYQSLFACEELDNGLREYIMSIASEFDSSSYSYGEDYEGIYVNVYKYYTKKGELIATIKEDNGEYLLDEFNRCMVRDWEKTDIQKNVDELNKKRMYEIDKVFEYLGKNNMSYKLKSTLKRDCFQVNIWEKEDVFGNATMEVIMKDKRFNFMYSCKFVENENNFEEITKTSNITPLENDLDGKILNTHRHLMIGVAGELKEYFNTKLLEKKRERKYKYAVAKIDKLYIKETGLTLQDLRREKKTKSRWFGL